MKTGASDDSRNAVSIHIGSDGRPSKELHERVLIDDSNPEDIVIRIMECASLRIDFDKSPQSGWEWNAAASLKMQQPENQAPIALLPVEDSETISSEDVPLAQVRWSSIPPSPELLSRQSRLSGAGNEMASRQETVESIQDSPPAYEFRQTPSADELQIVKTSYPPPNSAENAWRRRPVFWVSAAAMLVLAWVVGIFLMTSPLDTDYQKRAISYFEQSAHGFDNGDDAFQKAASMPPLKTETAGITVVPAKSESALFAMHRTSGSAAVANARAVEASEPQEKKTPEDGLNSDTVVRVSASRDEDANRKLSPNRDSVPEVKPDATDTPHSDVSAAPEPAEVLPDAQGGAPAAVAPARNDPAPLVDDADVATAIGEASLTTLATPAKPTRASVKEAMTEIAPYIRHCKLTTPGRVVLEIVVAGESGQVVSARAVDDTFKGTATGLCAARVVKGATLPAFQKDRITIIYPFDL